MIYKSATLAILLTFSQPLLAHKINFNDMHCMADNLHHEAKVDGMRGMEAVASVVMNRVRDSRYPDTVCDVVYQPSQFSWTLKKENSSRCMLSRSRRVKLTLGRARVEAATERTAASAAPGIARTAAAIPAPPSSPRRVMSGRRDPVPVESSVM